MRTKHHVMLYTFLSLALLTAVFVALSASLEARRVARALEDSYAQRVLEAQEHLQAIGLKLAKAPVAAGVETQVELLCGVSRQADGVVGGLSALPLSHAAMSDTVKFCNQLSEYAMALALQAASGAGLSADEWRRLSELQSQCALLTGQFATAREEMVAQSLSLGAEGNVFYAQPAQDARPLEQVADGDHGMDYPSMIYDGAFSDARRTGEPKALGLEQVTQEQAVAAARAFVGEDRVASAVPGVDTGGVLACYGVTVTLSDGIVLNVDVTRQGGRVLWIMPEHAAFDATMTLEECRDSAARFLQDRGFGPVEANHYQVYDGLAVINFAPVEDGVLLYPDLIKAQVRMDTGELVGLEATGYWMNHAQRASLSPRLSQAEAAQRVSPQLQQTGVRLCLIPQLQSERLCYEISGTYEENEYRVYIDAQTGEEAEILLLLSSPSGQTAA